MEPAAGLVGRDREVAELCAALAAGHSVLVPGGPERTTAVALKTRRVSARAVLEALSRLETAGRIYLLGTVRAPGLRAEPPTLAVAGDLVTLEYATPDRLQAVSDTLFRDVDLVAQVRHASGLSVPEVSLPDPDPLALPPALARWTAAAD